MQKYWQVFKMGWQSMLEYRTNVVLGHVRNLIAIGVVYVLWDAAYRNQQLFSTFDRQEMLTYVFGSYILISIVFMFVSESIAHDITRGDLSKNLIKPINYLWGQVMYRLPNRIFFLVVTIAELIFFVKITGLTLPLPTGVIAWGVIGLSVLLSMVLFTLLDFSIGLITFWTLYPYGPRFIFRVLLEFFSGWLFPFELLPVGLIPLFRLLPFGYLIYFPNKILSGEYTRSFLISGFVGQVSWIIIFFLVVKYLWKEGVKRYEGFE